MENTEIAFTHALASGDLVEATAAALDVGFEWPVGLAKAVHNAVTKQSGGNLAAGVWELLFAAKVQAAELARTHPEAKELAVSAVVGNRRGRAAIVHALMVVGVDEGTQNPCVVFLKPAFLEKPED